MGVRPLAEPDIPQVADLYWTYMRHLQGSAPRSVQTSLRELYFTGPFADPALPSLVYQQESGKVVGFLGVTVRKMTARGELIRVVYGGNFVIHPDARSRLAAPRLLGIFMARDQDLTLTDSANDLSRSVIERLGFQTVPALNMHWVRLLRPSQFAVHALCRATGPALSSMLKSAARPFCTVADNIAVRFADSTFGQKKSSLHGMHLDVETLLHCLVEYRNGYLLWAEYDADSLRWLLNFMERIPARGKLRKVILRDDNQKIVGWYIYYLKPGSVGDVVQIGGDPKFTQNILDHLFYDAWEQGVIALRGVLDIRRMADFSAKHCFFTCRGGWALAYSRNPELIKVLERGEALLSRLDGEWCLDPG